MNCYFVELRNAHLQLQEEIIADPMRNDFRCNAVYCDLGGFRAYSWFGITNHRRKSDKTKGMYNNVYV